MDEQTTLTTAIERLVQVADRIADQLHCPGPAHELQEAKAATPDTGDAGEGISLTEALRNGLEYVEATTRSLTTASEALDAVHMLVG